MAKTSKVWSFSEIVLISYALISSSSFFGLITLSESSLHLSSILLESNLLTLKATPTIGVWAQISTNESAITYGGEEGCYQGGYNDALGNPEFKYPYSLKKHDFCEEFSSTSIPAGYRTANPYMRGFIDACEHTANTSSDRAENRATCEAFAESEVLQNQN